MTTCLPLSLSRILRIACYLIGAMAAILMTPRLVAQQPAFLTNGLVAYYPFNGNANDVSGNGNHGVINGAGVSFGVNRFGTVGHSVAFDGISYVSVANNAELNPQTITVSTWIFKATLSRKYEAAVSHNGIINGEYGWKFQFNYNGDLEAPLGDETGVIPKYSGVGVWQHHVLTYSGYRLFYYLNGVAVNTSTIQHGFKAIQPVKGDLSFGRHSKPEPGIQGDGYAWFTGSLDDVRIYNRALSESEVKSLYTYESTPPNLVSITSQPTNITTDIGKDVSFSVTATNALTYQWFKDGNALLSGTNSTLSFTNARPAIIGDYFAVASNAYGTATSSVASLNIKGVDSGIWKGLVAYYPFNGNANDESGNGNDGVASGATPFSDRFNKEVGALKFNGDGANVKMGSQVTSVISNGIFSFSFWAKISSGGTWSPRLMTSGMVDVGIDSTTGSAKVFYGGSGFDSGNNIWSPDRIESSKYYNIAGTYDRLKAVLYINGKLVATQTSSWGARGYKNATATVGINPENGSDRFSGAVDDVRIYNRALSESEVKSLYTYESTPPNPVSITSHPTSIITDLTKDVSFSVTATNAITYQWFKDGNALPSATNAIISLTNARPVLIGDYYAVASNTYGTATSSVASLNINGVDSGIWKGLMAYFPFTKDTKCDLNSIELNSLSTPEITQSTNGLQFNGIDQYLIGESHVGYINNQGEYTISFFANLDPKANNWILSEGPDGAVFYIYLFGNGVLKVSSWSDKRQPTFWIDAHSNPINATGWHFISVTYKSILDSKTGWIRFYIDGTLQSERMFGETSFASDKVWVAFGAEIHNVLNQNIKPPTLKGGLRSFYIHNRSLNDNDVKSLYNLENPYLKILSNPDSVVSTAGATAEFVVKATNSSPLVALSYQWQKDGNSILGATNSFLTITNVQPVNIGDYNVIVSGGFQAVTSTLASLSLEGVNSGIWKGLVAWYPLNGNANDKSGNEQNGEALGAKWETDRFGNTNSCVSIFDDQHRIIVDEARLPHGNSDRSVILWYLPKIPPSPDGNKYTLLSYGDNGISGPLEAGKQFWITVINRQIVFETPYNGYSWAGDRALSHWNSIAIVIKSGVVTAFYNGVNIGKWVPSASNTPIDTNPNTKLVIGGYRGDSFQGLLDDLRIYDRALSDSDVKALYESERVPDTIIVTQPQSVTLTAGAKATFSVTATNSSPLVSLTYQWQKDGNPIPGATNSFLTITNVQPVNIGDYNLIVSGGFQAVTSASASLSLEGVNSGIWKGLVAWYKFSGNLEETTQGFRSNGRGIKFGKDRFGTENSAGVFSRVDRSQIRSSVTLLPIGNSSRTFSIWYNGSGIQGAGGGSLFGYGNRSSSENFGEWLLTLDGPNEGLVGWGDLSMGEGLVGGKIVGKWKSGPAAFMDDRWHNLIVRYNSTNLDLFLDGRALIWGAGAFASPLNTKLTELTIGSTYWDDWFYTGLIDDFRIYNHPLSDAEVKSLYESERVPDTVITRQPQSAAVAVGGSVRLEVETSNPIPTVQFAYQWFKDGAKLVGATNSTLNLGQLRPEQIGTYTVTVDDGSRTLTSTAANVSLQGVDSSIWKGLIASYTFEGDFSDSSGFGDSLVPYGVVNFVDQGRRPETKVARVTGLDGFLVGPERSWFSGVQPRTVSVWIKPEVTSTNVATVLTLGGLENCAERFSLQVPVAQNGIRFDGGDCTNGLRSKTFTGAPISSKWTHAVLTYDGSSVRCYVNGLASGTAYAVALSTDPIAPLVIGNTVGLGSEGFSGLVDDVRIYNRSLSATEVRALFNYESTGVAPSLPQITRQPTPLSGYEGETLKISVEASGYQLGYQWQRGGQNLASDLRLLGINSSELQIKGARLDDGGDYRVLVTNSFGAVTSSTVKLTVVPPVRSLVAGLANEVQEGQRMTFPLSMVSTGDVGGLTFKLTYNPAFLTDPKVEWSAVVGQSVNSVNTTTAGEVSGAFSLAGTALSAGTVPVGTVNFRARSVPMMTNVTLNPVIVSIGNPSGGSSTSGNGAIAGEGRIRPRRIKGDNNANQRVDIGDATVISRLQVGLEEARPWDVALNDLNDTATLDNGDIIKALRTVVGLDPQPGPMGDAKRLSPVLPMERAPVSTNYSADLALLDGPAIKVGQPYRVAVRLRAGRGNLTGLSFSLRYPASLELKEKVIGAEIPADALPAWNVSGSRAKLAVIRPKAWAAQSGEVVTFTFQPTPEAAKQIKLPISLEEVEVSDVGEGLSAVPSVWLEIGGGLEFAPQLRVMRTSPEALSLEILGPKGLPLALESSEDLSAWSEIQSVSGQGIDAVISVNVTPPESVRAKFWRVTIK